MIRIAGNIASTILSSPAYWYILTDNVSKSNGLKINVMGNSFIVSTKTKSDPTNIGPWSRGRAEASRLKKTKWQHLKNLEKR